MAAIDSNRQALPLQSVCRTRRGREFWQRFIARWPRSGLTQAEYCRRGGVPRGSFCWWRYRLVRQREEGSRTRDDRVTFVPVRVVADTPRTASPATRSAEPGPLEVVTTSGHVVRVRPDCDLHWLRRVVEALEGSKC